MLTPKFVQILIRPFVASQRFSHPVGVSLSNHKHFLLGGALHSHINRHLSAMGIALLHPSYCLLIANWNYFIREGSLNFLSLSTLLPEQLPMPTTCFARFSAGMLSTHSLVATSASKL